MVGEVVDVALDAEIEEERGGRVGPVVPVVGVVAAPFRGQQFLLGVGVVGVAHDQIRLQGAGRRFDLESARAAFDLRCRAIGVVLDAEFRAQVRDAVDDRADPAVGVPDAEVEIDVAHQVVERRRVGRRAAEKHQRVLHDLLELRMVEVAST